MESADIAIVADRVINNLKSELAAVQAELLRLKEQLTECDLFRVAAESECDELDKEIADLKAKLAQSEEAKLQYTRDFDRLSRQFIESEEARKRLKEQWEVTAKSLEDVIVERDQWRTVARE